MNRVRRAMHRLIVVAAALLTGCASGEHRVAVPGRVEIGAPAPEYRAVSLTGDSVALAGERGSVVLLNVWATWCHPCRAEVPELRSIRETYKSRGFELIGVSVDAAGTEDDIREFMAEFAMSYPIWRDPDERVSARFLIVGVPATFLIDRNGILRWRKTGPIARGDTSLKAAIERALSESVPAGS